LREIVGDLEPGRLGIYKNVPVGTKLRIVIEEARVDLQPRRVAGRIRYRRSAATAELGAIGRRSLAYRGFKRPD
jgi:hypothetical protein